MLASGNALLLSSLGKNMNRVALLVFGIAGAHLLQAAPPQQRSISPSRQFIIYGADAELRGAISDLAERTKTNFLAVLRQHDGWKTPLVVNLQPQQANLPELAPADLHFSQTGFGLKLQLDLIISKNLDAPLIEREFLRAIILEMMYRNRSHIAAGTPLVEPPPWLVEGVLALAPGTDRGPLLTALADTDKPMPLEKFLAQKPELMDSAGRKLYRAYAFALVQMLVEGSKDSARLTNYIVDLPDSSTEPLANVEAHFPSLTGDVENSWRLTLRRLSDYQANELLTFTESERRLEEYLRLEVPETNKPAKSATLEELAIHKLSPAEKTALKQFDRELMVFVVQANPVLRPIAREYQQVGELLALGKRRGIPKRLSGLETTRKQLAVRMIEINDYINWFEATQMTKGSGNFGGYLKAADQSQLSVSKRNDPLSLYVDALEDQFGN